VKIATYIGGLFGLALLITLVVQANLGALVQTFASGGWPLLWLVPYRIPFFLLYAWGWLELLRSSDPLRRADLSYLSWVTMVREAVDRLLPVASVGGSVVGVRLVAWRGITPSAVAASVLVEMVLTLMASYVFAAMGLFLLLQLPGMGLQFHRFVDVFLITLPIPVVTLLVFRGGAFFGHLHKFILPIVGQTPFGAGVTLLDQELRASLRRGRPLIAAGALQLAALLSGSFEIWFALRLFGHPVGPDKAVILESLTLAARHMAFVVPAGLGVQEAGLVVFGGALGIISDVALAVSMVKRARELLWGVPALISWQWFEGRRLRSVRVGQ
jgi:putative membrane protein